MNLMHHRCWLLLQTVGNLSDHFASIQKALWLREILFLTSAVLTSYITYNFYSHDHVYLFCSVNVSQKKFIACARNEWVSEYVKLCKRTRVDHLFTGVSLFQRIWGRKNKRKETTCRNKIKTKVCDKSLPSFKL